MGLISWFIVLFVVVRLFITGYNFLMQPYLPRQIRVKEDVFLSILIPARNEEKKLASLLTDLIDQHLSFCEILVYDDLSTDRTSQIVAEISCIHPLVRLLKGKELPAGWLGKNHACYQLAKSAKGDYLLFLDADVRVEQFGILRLLSYIQNQQLSLLSLFPRQQIEGIGTWLSVPLMNWILLSLLPLPLVRRLPYLSLSAANGQCMMFEAHEYRKLQPHAVMRANPVEDIAIMKFYKQNYLPVDLLLGSDTVSCRMYSGWKESVTGFSKNVFQFFGGYVSVAFLFALITTFAGMWLWYDAGIKVGLVYLLSVVLIRVLFSLLSYQNVIMNLLLIIPQQITFWIILINAYICSKRHLMVWKERNI